MARENTVLTFQSSLTLTLGLYIIHHTASLPAYCVHMEITEELQRVKDEGAQRGREVSGIS